MHLKPFLGLMSHHSEGTYVCECVHNCKQSKRMINLPISKNKAKSQCSVNGTHTYTGEACAQLSCAESHKFFSPVQFGNDFSMNNIWSCNTCSAHGLHDFVDGFGLAHIDLSTVFISCSPKATHWEWCPNSGWSFAYTHELMWLPVLQLSSIVFHIVRPTATFDICYAFWFQFALTKLTKANKNAFVFAMVQNWSPSNQA